MDLYEEANAALNEYIEYMQYEGDDIGNEERRWQFIDSAIEILEAITARKVGDEIN